MAKDIPYNKVTVLSPLEIGAVITATGWHRKVKADKVTEFLDIAIAVCLQESSGNRLARNGRHYGLFQISEIHKPMLDKVAPGTWKSITTAAGNTYAAQLVWLEAGSSWKPWEAYTSGAYQKHLGHGVKVHKELLKRNWIEQPLGETLPGLVAGPKGDEWIKEKMDNIVVNPIDKVLGFAKEAGITVGVFLLALVCIVLGVWFLMSQTKAGKAAINVAGGVVPVGKALKAAKGVKPMPAPIPPKKPWDLPVVDE